MNNLEVYLQIWFSDTNEVIAFFKYNFNKKSYHYDFRKLNKLR